MTASGREKFSVWLAAELPPATAIMPFGKQSQASMMSELLPITEQCGGHEGELRAWSIARPVSGPWTSCAIHWTVAVVGSV